MGVAEQEFRDGAASGAGAMAFRAQQLESWGIPLTPEIFNKLAENIASEMGGSVYQIGTNLFEEDKDIPRFHIQLSHAQNFSAPGTLTMGDAEIETPANVTIFTDDQGRLVLGESGFKIKFFTKMPGAQT